MSVDADGYDSEVLKPNNWEKYRPMYALAEILEICLHAIEVYNV